MAKRCFVKKGISSLLLLLALAAAPAAVVHAGEMDVLIDKLVEKGVINKTDGEAILKETKAAEKAKPKKEEAKSSAWAEKIKLSGDLRLRYQSEEKDSATRSRERARFRWRLGADAKVVDKVTVGFGLASGGNDPRSTNQTFQDAFASKELRIDYAYAKYAPTDWLSLTGGKIKNPLWLPADLLWDSDITPEGAVVQLTQKFDFLKVFFNAGVLVLDELSTAGDPLIVPIQLGADWKLTNNVNLKVAPTYYLASSVKGAVLDFRSGSNTLVANGTPTTADDGLKFDFDALAVGAELGVKDTFVPYIGIFGEYVNNPDPDTDNSGYLAGIKIGDKKVSDKGTWQLKYMYRKLEKDAWLDTFPDSDFFGGATNVKGHEVIAEYGLAKHVTFGIDYYNTENITTKVKEDLVQFDLIFKF